VKKSIVLAVLILCLLISFVILIPSRQNLLSLGMGIGNTYPFRPFRFYEEKPGDAHRFLAAGIESILPLHSIADSLRRGAALLGYIFDIHMGSIHQPHHDHVL
jgi:hypothetical protein